MGFSLFLHSLTLIARNFSAALKVSLGPALFGIVVSYAALGLAPDETTGAGAAVGPMMGDDPMAMMDNISGGAAVVVLALAVMWLFIMSWIAIAWHRFVLREDFPGVLPSFDGRRMARYVGLSILIALLVLIVITVGGMVLGVLMMALGSGSGAMVGALVGVILGLIAGYAGLRLSLGLPGIAVGEPLSLGQSWEITGRLAGPIFSVSIILALFQMLLSLVVGALPLPASVLSVVSLAASWLTLMLGISILTTLYGHLVENRALPS